MVKGVVNNWKAGTTPSSLYSRYVSQCKVPPRALRYLHVRRRENAVVMSREKEMFERGGFSPITLSMCQWISHLSPAKISQSLSFSRIPLSSFRGWAPACQPSRYVGYRFPALVLSFFFLRPSFFFFSLLVAVTLFEKFDNSQECQLWLVKFTLTQSFFPNVPISPQTAFPLPAPHLSLCSFLGHVSLGYLPQVTP